MSARKNLVVIITGGVTGIGRATAERMAANGHRVFVTSRSVAPGALTSGIEVVRLDVADAAWVTACVQTVIDAAGRVDVLINNVGTGMIGAVEELSEDEARYIVETLFWSAVRMTKAVLPGMRVQGSGRIINMSSIGGKVGMSFSAFYSVGKHALEAFSEALHLEVEQFGIHVSIIQPGGVNTPTAGNVPMAAVELPAYGKVRYKIAAMVEKMMRKGLAPDDVAKTICSVIDAPSPGLRYKVGASATLMLGFMRFMPERVSIWVMRKMNNLS